ncbi:ABC transporter ATP-binding protein [Rothia sp. P5764]|uniref:ABC transporter ATP-binding protein n=1 Tax=Rothia sp. P5764 TaxID=3402654 RepID=UPI003ACEB9E2
MIAKLRLLFPGNKFVKLMGFVALLFLVSLFDLVGVAAILPVIDLVTGADPNRGYLSIIYNFLGKPSKNNFIIIACIFLVSAFIFKGIFSLIVKWKSSGFIAYQQTATSATLLKNFVYGDYVENRKKTSGEVMRDTSDSVGATYSYLVTGTLTIIGEVFSIILIMMLLVVVMPLPALFAFVYFALTGFILQKYLAKKNLTVGKNAIEAALKAISSTIELTNGYREARIFGVADRFVYRVQQNTLRSVDATRARNFLTEIPRYILEIIFIIGIALVLSIIMLQGGTGSAPYLLVFAGACIRILPSYTRIVASLGSVKSGQAAFDIVEKQLRQIPSDSIELLTEPDIGNYSRVNATQVSVQVDLEGVTYAYPDGTENVLEDINFSVPAGTSLALVGGSGSGKTTLVDIILGLIKQNQGTIKINGISTEDNLDNLLLNVGYVPQNVFFGSSTLVESIAFGKNPDEIDIPRVYECIKLAELEDVVNNLEDGIYTDLGDQGSRLSGGQRQRVGIARALYRKPSFIILDEATSALDNETEHKITETMHRLSGEVTFIVIAHRLSTVRNVDQLVFLKDGKIAVQGTFSEVRQKNPEFARLVELGQLPE